ncbi:hypothetical protein [Paracoccus alkenifer]|uniref:Uncharacterized protein n=1 Tax=Paracoccus alkenifer TaxID=65735 RepID=A0A1H6L8F7_9RHOB|nr:hypothetical protein [Paracoccus alkenifer]SEH84568.1 hypothetical protein SAMN04488075_1400 [Paracoccus alkenifer]
MALPRESSGIGIWPMVIGVAAVILAAVLFFMFVPIQKPVPTPDSPAALGIDGEPAGATGAGVQPGTPQGTEAAPAVVPVEPAPSN